MIQRELDLANMFTHSLLIFRTIKIEIGQHGCTGEDGILDVLNDLKIVQYSYRYSLIKLCSRDKNENRTNSVI